MVWWSSSFSLSNRYTARAATLQGRKSINRYMSDHPVTLSPIQPLNVLSDYTRTYDLGVNQVTAHIEHSRVGNGPVRVSEVTYTTYSSSGELSHAPPPLGGKIDLSA